MMGDWTFFSNHGHVFFCLARNGDARLRDVAADVGITERAVQKIVKDLQAAGYIEVRKQGRCNRYRINRRKSLRHPLEAHCTISKLVNLVLPGARAPAVPAMAAVEQPSSAAGGESDEAVASRPDPRPEAEVATVIESAPSVAPTEPAATAPVAAAEPADEATEEQPAAAAPEEKERRKDGKKSKGKSEPIDVRQQGSLF